MGATIGALISSNYLYYFGGLSGFLIRVIVCYSIIYPKPYSNDEGPLYYDQPEYQVGRRHGSGTWRIYTVLLDERCKDVFVAGFVVLAWLAVVRNPELHLHLILRCLV